MKVQVFADFEEALTADINVRCDKKVELVIDYSIPEHLTPVPDDTIRFFATIQPEGYYNHIIKAHPESYTYLLTNLHELLELPNSHFLISCTAFVPPSPDIKKKFGVSTVIGGRRGLPGHALRHELWLRRDEIKIPAFFYLGYRTKWNEVDYSNQLTLTPQKDEKLKVFDCMFHIAIESYNRDDCFSEKLIDPLITKTVPIYWGCPNIGQFFNYNGYLKCNTVDEIIQTCNELTEDYYLSHPKVIEINYNEALKYVNYGDQLQRKIQEVLDANA